MNYGGYYKILILSKFWKWTSRIRIWECTNDCQEQVFDNEQVAFGKAYAKEILKTLGIAYKEESLNNETSYDELFHRCIARSFKDKGTAEKRKIELELKGCTGVFLEAFRK